MKKYIILYTGRDTFYTWEKFDKLEQEVNKKMEMGYIPLGTPQKFSDGDNSGYYQAMIFKGE